MFFLQDDEEYEEEAGEIPQSPTKKIIPLPLQTFLLCSSFTEPHQQRKFSHLHAVIKLGNLSVWKLQIQGENEKYFFIPPFFSPSPSNFSLGYKDNV